jgi:hypothetical protein
VGGEMVNTGKGWLWGSIKSIKNMRKQKDKIYFSFRGTEVVNEMVILISVCKSFPSPPKKFNC